MLAALGSVAVGGATAVSTGAFNSAEVDRGISVATNNDTGSLVGLNPVDSQNAELNSNGNLELTFTGRDEGGPFGLNANSNIIYNDVFQITNNFQETVAIAVGGNGSKVYAKADLPEDQKDRLGLVGDNTDIGLNTFSTGETGSRLDAGNSGLGAIFLNSANRVQVTSEPVNTDPDDPGNFSFKDSVVENNDKFLAPGDSATVSLQFFTGPNPQLDANKDSSGFFDGGRTDIAILAATAEQVPDSSL